MRLFFHLAVGQGSPARLLKRVIHMTQTDQDAKTLAMHFSSIGDNRQAYHYYVEAGNQVADAKALAHYEAALQHWDPRDFPNEITRRDVGMLVSHAYLLAYCGRRTEAQEHNARVFEFLTDDMLPEKAKALRSRGYIGLCAHHNLEQVEEDFKAAMEIYRELKDEKMVMGILRKLSSLYQRFGKVSDAIEMARLTAKACRDSGGRFANDYARLHEGDAAFYQCQFTEARQLMEGPIYRLRAGDALHKHGSFIHSLACIYYYVGEFEQANELLHELLDVGRKSGQVGFQKGILIWLSKVAFEQNNMLRAEAYAQQALACDVPQNSDRVYPLLAVIQASMGNVDQAMDWFEKTRQTPFESVDTTMYLSMTLSMVGRREEAEAGFLPLTNIEKAQNSFFQAQALVEAGVFYIRGGYTERARELLGAAGKILRTMGATHFAQKAERLLRELPEQSVYFLTPISTRHRLGDLIGQSDVMRLVYTLIEQAGASDVTVLVRGETGTGKEVAAKEIHFNSRRKGKPFLSLNCSALSDELLQSELFGHKKGSFTGASIDRIGLFESAHGGTIFLDEIGDASAKVQSNLLRVLQEGEVRRLGEHVMRKVDVRVITATNRDLEADVKHGRFRQDLYYRLQVLQIDMPPLRDRLEDVPHLAEHFLKRVTEENGLSLSGFSKGAIRALMHHVWPGNVRELENEIRRAVAVVGQMDVIKAEHFSERVTRRGRVEGEGGQLQAQVVDFEKRIILEALSACDGNVSRTAARLGLSRQGLYKKMNRYGLRDQNDAV